MGEAVNHSDPAHPAGSDESWAIDPARAEQFERTVADYVGRVASLDPGGKSFLRTVASVDRLGQREFSMAAAMSDHMLERRLDSARDMLAAKAPLAHQLAELRKIVDELDPSRLGAGQRRSRGRFGRGSRNGDDMAGYFERFAHAEERIEAILRNLAEGRLALERDNALLNQEQVSLATVMAALREHAYFAGRLDEALTAQVDVVARTDPERADHLRADLLYAVRRRRQEILTQLAVTTQAYGSLRIVEEGNDGMARALATATTTTAAALRTAVMVAQAVAGQRIAAKQIEAASAAASDMAEEVGELLGRQSAAVRGGLERAGAREAMLRRAWDEVFAALDRVDDEKERALRAISSVSLPDDPAKPPAEG
jgi:uncharacterized protein YaaN involved in tellurite resistance